MLSPLFDAVTETAASEGRALTFSNLLGFAHDQAGGDLPEALRRLIISTRMLACWQDTYAVTGLPDLSHGQTVDIMNRWQNSIAAFKDTEPQDTAGDMYYVSTIAWGEVLFANRSESPMANRLARGMMRYGSAVMHAVKNNPLSLSDHTISNHMQATKYAEAVSPALVR